MFCTRCGCNLRHYNVFPSFCSRCGNPLRTVKLKTGTMLNQEFVVTGYIKQTNFSNSYITKGRDGLIYYVKEHLINSGATRLGNRLDIKQFQKEVEVTKLFTNYANITKYVTSFTQNGRYYLVTDYYKNNILFSDIVNPCKTSYKNKITIIYKLIATLKPLFNERILHCDIAAHNFLFFWNDVILIDFGLSRFVGEVLPPSDSGTKNLRHPDAGSYPSHSTDLFSTLVVAAQILSGKEFITENEMKSKFLLYSYSDFFTLRKYIPKASFLVQIFFTIGLQIERSKSFNIETALNLFGLIAMYEKHKLKILGVIILIIFFIKFI